MNNELLTVLSIIKQRTGIDVEIINLNASKDISERTEYNLNKLPSGNVYVDEVDNKTYFKFRFKDFDYVGMINRATEIEKNYAYLMISYIESNAKDGNFGKIEGIKSIILGDYTKNQALRFIRKYNLEDSRCCVILINCLNQAKDIIDFMDSYLINDTDVCVGIDDKTVAVVKFLDNLADGESLNDFLQMLSDNIRDELRIDVKIAVGGMVPSLIEGNTSFLQAQSTFRMSNVFSKKNNIHTYKEYTLVRMLEDLPKFKIAEYLDVLSNNEYGEIFDDEEMIKTCEEFLDNDLMISETSRKLFMHRNTLTYRLDKVESKTGLDIRHFPDAVTFRLVTILRKLNSRR